MKLCLENRSPILHTFVLLLWYLVVYGREYAVSGGRNQRLQLRLIAMPTNANSHNKSKPISNVAVALCIVLRLVAVCVDNNTRSRNGQSILSIHNKVPTVKSRKRTHFAFAISRTSRLSIELPLGMKNSRYSQCKLLFTSHTTSTNRDKCLRAVPSPAP